MSIILRPTRPSNRFLLSLAVVAYWICVAAAVAAMQQQEASVTVTEPVLYSLDQVLVTNYNVTPGDVHLFTVFKGEKPLLRGYKVIEICASSNFPNMLDNNEELPQMEFTYGYTCLRGADSKPLLKICIPVRTWVMPPGEEKVYHNEADVSVRHAKLLKEFKNLGWSLVDGKRNREPGYFFNNVP